VLSFVPIYMLFPAPVYDDGGEIKVKMVALGVFNGHVKLNTNAFCYALTYCGTEKMGCEFFVARG
jgi:hypothetical protein